MSIRNLKSTASLVVALLLCACAATPKVCSDRAPGATLAGYHSFAMVPRPRVEVSLPPDALNTPLIVSGVEDEIKQALQRRGFALADPERADFLVDFTIGAAERVDIQCSPGGWGGGPLWASGNWGSNIDEYRDGTLAIDVLDAREWRPVWRGWGTKELTSKEVEQPAEPIRDAVQSVLARFPQP